MPIKLSKSLAKSNFVKLLIQKGSIEIKSIMDYEEHKLNPQLITDLVNFIELEVSKSKFSSADLDKSGIVTEIMKQCFPEIAESDLAFLENTITFLLDNNLVKKNTFLKQGLTLIKSVIPSSKTA